MSYVKVPIASSLRSPTAGIKHVIPSDCDFKKCEINMNIGIFFDGTNNNKDKDFASRADSNIARLYDAYISDQDRSYYRQYVPGVGTKFTEIGNESQTPMGEGFGIGCESRVLFGLLAVFNFLHRKGMNDVPLFNKDEIKALCRNDLIVDPEDEAVLARLGITGGLLSQDISGDGLRLKFLTKQAALLDAKLKKAKPRVAGCLMDVFGFSRGAAEARVFCSWLNQFVVDGKFAGVPLRLRFVGLFDTVASAGFFSGTSAFVSNSTGRHSGWARAEFLRLPLSVENCVHMVAMHELRKNFPLDEIGLNGVMRPGSHQYAYPGSHSDVGGGYEPGKLGVSVAKEIDEGDSLKLSQIPLNHMFDCAVAAGAPLEKPSIIEKHYDPFAIHPRLARAYEDFISAAGSAPRPLYEWLQPYLNWRWQVRDSFAQCHHVKLASSDDKQILIAFNDRLIDDAKAMLRSSTSVGRRVLAVALDFTWTGARNDLRKTSLLDPEAREVLGLAQRALPTPPAFATLFDGYVHDSLAGFDKPLLEATGYWRYRKVFLGDDRPVVATNQDSEIARNAA